MKDENLHSKRVEKIISHMSSEFKLVDFLKELTEILNNPADFENRREEFFGNFRYVSSVVLHLLDSFRV